MEPYTLYMLITIAGHKPIAIGGFPTHAAYCHNRTVYHKETPEAFDSYICIKAPAFVVDPRHWRLVGNKIIYIQPKSIRLSGDAPK